MCNLSLMRISPDRLNFRIEMYEFMMRVWVFVTYALRYKSKEKAQRILESIIGIHFTCPQISIHLDISNIYRRYALSNATD
jgi:hypothetical protein